MKLSIKGYDWSISYYKPKEYKHLHQDCANSMAVTLRDKKEIHFNIKYLSKKVAIHELLHAHVVECCIGSADLDTDALEEVVAVLLEDSIFSIIELSETIVKVGKKCYS